MVSVGLQTPKEESGITNPGLSSLPPCAYKTKDTYNNRHHA